MKSYIIHLSRIESSLTSAVKVKAQLDSFNMENELFEGSYGNEIKEEYNRIGRRLHPWSFKGPQAMFTEEYRNAGASAGVMGCFDSHYRLWKKCVDLNKPILIFEDDVMLVRQFSPVEWTDDLSVAFSHSKKMILYRDFLDNPSGKPKAEVYKQSSMPGNGGYAIHPHAAKILVDTYANTFLPADNAINQHHVKIQIHNYMMGRALSKHEGNISTIRTHLWNDLANSL
jgi:glycosyl transferase family 25